MCFSPNYKNHTTLNESEYILHLDLYLRTSVAYFFHRYYLLSAPLKSMVAVIPQHLIFDALDKNICSRIHTTVSTIIFCILLEI